MQLTEKRIRQIVKKALLKEEISDQLLLEYEGDTTPISHKFSASTSTSDIAEHIWNEIYNREDRRNKRFTHPRNLKKYAVNKPTDPNPTINILSFFLA